MAIVRVSALPYLWNPMESAAKRKLALPDEILTVEEIAKLLKVADKTIYTMAQNAELPCFKVRGQWRFRCADIDRWIKAQTTGRRTAKNRRGKR
jgi:excisionase family DNA binding protein